MKKRSPAFVFYMYKGGFAFAFAFVTTIFSIYHIDMVKMNTFQLVIIGTILELTCFIFEIPTGIIADHYSRKLSIVLGLIIMGFGFFIEGSFPVFATVAIAQIIWGFGATFLSGADIAWLADEVKTASIDKILIKGTQVSQIATVLGILVSIQLATIKLNLPILISGALFAILGIVLWILMPENNFFPDKYEKGNRIKKYLSTFKRGVLHIKQNRILLIMFAAIIIGGLFNEGWDRLWTYRFLRDLSFPERHIRNPLYWFALINIVAALLNFSLIQIFKKRLEQRTSKGLFAILAILNLYLSASIIFFATTGNFYIALAMYWASYTFRHTALPLSDILINKNITDSNIRATVFSMKGQMDQIGQMAGGPMIGYLALRFSVSFGLSIVGMLILPAVILFMLLRKNS